MSLRPGRRWSGVGFRTRDRGWSLMGGRWPFRRIFGRLGIAGRGCRMSRFTGSGTFRLIPHGRRYRTHIAIGDDRLGDDRIGRPAMID
jgi:hypothetical protein